MEREEGIFKYEDFCAMLSTMKSIRDCDHMASKTKDRRRSRMYLERKKKVSAEIVDSLNKMNVAYVEGKHGFLKFEEVVRFARENDLHKVEGVTVRASGDMTKYELDDVRSGCRELHLKVEALPPSPPVPIPHFDEKPKPRLPRFDHWTSLKDD